MFRKLNTHTAGLGTAAILIDGVTFLAEEGEPLAAVLLRTPPFTSRTTPISGAQRAPFCMMGACFECLVEINGETSMRSCMVRVHDGMVVKRQACRPNPGKGPVS